MADIKMGNDALLVDAYQRLRAAVRRLDTAGIDSDDNGDASPSTSAPTLPSAACVDTALAALPRPGRPNYLSPRGDKATLVHLVDTVLPGLNGQSRSGRYYGFVTGGTLPVAEAADNIVTALDQNLHAHLPRQTVSTAVEHAALQMLADVLSLGDIMAGADAGATLTTGATASNVLGLALGREAVVRWRLREGGVGAAELGLLEACRAAGVSSIRILTSMAHSSLYKAASIIGLGRNSVVDLPHSATEPWRLDLDGVERLLSTGTQDGTSYIISVSAGEVNTGQFATTGLADMERLRALADKHNAWLHVDGAFGLFARALPDTHEFAHLRQCTEGIELADSIGSDGHKLLNVPYDAGIFFTRYGSLQQEVFQNANAVYLTGGAISSPAVPPTSDAGGSVIRSPMNMGIENSRRFRALPVYAVLLSEGREGLAAMQARMVHLARGIQEIVVSLPAYDCMGAEEVEAEATETGDGNKVAFASTHIVVLFWAKDDALNVDLASRINASRKMYVSPTTWRGRPACRIAVSSWRADKVDLAVVERVLVEAERSPAGQSRIAKNDKSLHK